MGKIDESLIKHVDLLISRYPMLKIVKKGYYCSIFNYGGNAIVMEENY